MTDDGDFLQQPVIESRLQERHSIRKQVPGCNNPLKFFSGLEMRFGSIDEPETRNDPGRLNKKSS
jgi:hypothetical protein